MKQINEETLMAYADGELDDKTAQTVAATIAADPALQAELENYRALKATVGSAFEALDKAPLPADLMAILDADKNATNPGQPAPAEKPSFWSRLFADHRLNMAWRPTLVIASLAIVASVMLLQTNGQGQPGLPINFATLLDSLPDGHMAGDMAIEESYLQNDGAFCRTFTNISKAADADINSRQRSLACKPTGGSWQILIAETLVPESAFLPAGAGAKSQITTLISAMQQLDAGAEQAYLHKK